MNFVLKKKQPFVFQLFHCHFWWEKWQMKVEKDVLRKRDRENFFCPRTFFNNCKSALIQSFFCYTLKAFFSLIIESFAAEKKELINEIVSLKKHLERKELDNARKISENEKMKQDFDTARVDLQESTSQLDVTHVKVSQIYHN